MKQKLKIFLLIWVLLMVFPLAWVVRFNPKLDIWFNTVFAPEWVHIVAHITLFMVIGLLIPWVFFQKSPVKSKLWKTTLVVLGIGIVQEIFQLLVKQRAFDFREVFDLVVDLGASVVGFGFYFLLSKIPSRKEKK